MEKTKLLVIVITTAAIITAATTTLSAASPAFARVNCNEAFSICSGGSSFKKEDDDVPGGHGGRTVEESGQVTISGGRGINSETLVGGGGFHRVCDDTGVCSKDVGGLGLHNK
jgi:hypothetical protein